MLAKLVGRKPMGGKMIGNVVKKAFQTPPAQLP